MSEAAANIVIPYSWQQSAWQAFLEQLQQQRLPHAMILSGPMGVGKRHFADAMAHYLLCQTPRSGLACGLCHSCRLIIAENHPDKSVLVPEEKARHIKVDQIRELNKKISATAQQGGRKVIIIEPVEALNVNAANAVLKSLEEPAQDTFFILVSHVISAVMATIRSRCQIHSSAIPDRSMAVAWLQELGFNNDCELALELAGGAPLLARRLFDESNAEQLTLFYRGLASQLELAAPDLGLAKDLLSIELSELFDWWLQLIHRLVLGQVEKVPGQGGNRELPHLQYLNALEAQSHKYHVLWLHRFSDKLLKLKEQYSGGANPNKQLLLEELLLDWYAIIRAAGQK